MDKIIVVVITGAAGRIAYSLIPLVCDGSIFGKDVKISLRLFDIPMAESKLVGLNMEILDSNYELLVDVVATTDQELAFQKAQVAILLGGFPRLQGMERKDLIAKNAEGMINQAKALDAYADKNVKVLIVANPANTNTLVALKQAVNIPKQNFTCLTRLDEERLRGFIASKVNQISSDKISSSQVKNIAIFGNHSSTQVPNIADCLIKHKVSNSYTPLIATIPDFVNNESEVATLTKQVQTRGADIIAALQASSALSAASAIGKHLHDWLVADIDNENVFSMGVSSDGNPYGIPDGLVFSFPCRRKSNEFLSSEFEIVGGFKISDVTTQELLKVTIDELTSERSDAELYIA